MTLCIAALAQRDDKILLATDGMLSLEYMSFDTTILKAMPLTRKKRFMMAFSGSPHHAQAISLRAAALLDGKEETGADVMDTCERAFREELTRKIEGEILSPFGYDRPAFLREGRANLGDEELLKNTRLETTILVCGFESSGTPRIFSVSDPGVATSHDAAGFYAIGSGSFTALGALYATYETLGPWLDIAYRICEAKFLGESALGVGKNTGMMVIEREGPGRIMPTAPIEQVRSVWKLGRPPVPDEARRIIQGGFQIKVKA